MAKLLDRRRTIVIILVSVLVSVCLLIALQADSIGALRSRIDDFKNKGQVEEDEDKFKPVPRPSYIDATRNHNTKEKLAYVTFLTGSPDHHDDDNLEEDNYLQAVRILVWQLVHQPETRTKHDVVIMVTPDVSQKRRDRLKRDGATIYPVDFLHVANDSWVTPLYDRFNNVMAKMRVWEMTQYDRILMLDGDFILRSSLDGVFDDPGAQLQKTKDVATVNYDPLPGEARLPETYLLAGLMEVWDSNHEFPPKEGTGLKDYGNMNAGFFVLAPSMDAFNYYVSLLSIPNSFDPIFPEQNLMNKAHMWDGPMPWREVDYRWNVRCPNENDFAKNVVSVHEKWWTQPFIYDNQGVKDWLHSRRYEMKGWYDAMELFEHQNLKNKPQQ